MPSLKLKGIAEQPSVMTDTITTMDITTATVTDIAMATMMTTITTTDIDTL